MTDTQTGGYGWRQDMDMSLLEKIKIDLKTALVGKDAQAKDTIRLIMGEFPGLTVPITLKSGKKTTRLKKSEEITNDDIQNIIRKLVKSEKTVLEIKKEATSEYLQHLELYLPKMAGRSEIEAWIGENVDLTAFKSPMQAMGPIMKHFGKRADGNLVKVILAGLGRPIPDKVCFKKSDNT